MVFGRQRCERDVKLLDISSMEDDVVVLFLITKICKTPNLLGFLRLYGFVRC